ncbi:MAG: oligosaccharide flippase family protein, partial [Lachnospiraceae bacterium]|nr:oligosaccharide flippase family protein [Lachnospiraceae bacterium]
MKKVNLAKNTMLLSFCTFINKGLMFVMVPFFSRWLSTEDYGTFDVFSTYVSLLIPIITLACSNAVFRLSVDKESKSDKSIYISNGLLIVLSNLLIAFILLFLWKCFAGFDYFVAFTILLVAEVLDNYFQGFLRAIKRLELYAISKSVGTVITALAVTLFVRVLDGGLQGILYGYAVGFILTDVAIILITNYKSYFNPKKFSQNGIRELVSYSLPLIPNDVSWWIINVSDRTIINFFLGAASNGIYAIAYKVPNICSSVFSMFSISWQEAATDMVNESDRNAYYQSVFSKMLNVLLTLCTGILACNFILFGWVFDAKYYEARLYAPILVSAIIFSSLSQFFGGIQISLKRPKENGVSTVIGAITNLLVHFLLINIIGLYAAAISTLASNVVVMLIRQFKLKDTFNLNYSRGCAIAAKNPRSY